jgi:hypothetical protein
MECRRLGRFAEGRGCHPPLTLPPAAIQGDAELVQALDLALSFETWRRLRTDQGADVAQARAVMRRIASALVGDTA